MSPIHSYVILISLVCGQFLLETANFLAEELLKIKITTEKLLFRSKSSASNFSEKLHFEKELIFRKSNKSYLFRVATFAKDATFYGS